MSELRNFINVIEAAGDLIRVEEPMSPRLDISSALQKFDGKKALFFENVKGYENQIVGGVCGTRARILGALKVEEENLYTLLQHAIENPMPCDVVDGPVKEVVVDDPKLSDFPILTHFGDDPGPYITSAVLHARSPDRSIGNVSFHRLLVLDDERMGIRIVPRHLFRLTQMAREAGQMSLDVSVSMGLSPVVSLVGALPAPFGTCEFDVANTLLEGGLKLTKCEHVDALAPADAELVLECRIRLDEEVTEGPFVDQSGTYDIQRLQPAVELVGAMHRENYIYQALLPSSAEHKLLMGMPREVRIYEYVRNVVPTVRGVNMTAGGMGWLHCVVSFEKFREGDPKNVLMAIFAAHPSLKHAVVVDSDINPYDMEQVEWAIATRFRGDEDLLVIPNVRVSSLDPSSDQEKELGCKVGFDATKPLGKKGFERPIIPVSDEVRMTLEKYSKGVGT
jgi:2,5-furandicarboxylate decarboxylase 1